MAARIGYRWHLRRLMADKDMYATTQLGPLLAERGITLSREQVYRLVTGIPERLSLATLAALCDILGCQPGDIIEVVQAPAGGQPPGQRRRARGERARIRGQRRSQPRHRQPGRRGGIHRGLDHRPGQRPVRRCRDLHHLVPAAVRAAAAG